MLNFIQVSFCFLLFLELGLGSVIGLGLGIGLGFGIGNLKIFDRWRCRQSGRSRPLAVCVKYDTSIHRLSSATHQIESIRAGIWCEETSQEETNKQTS